MRVLWNIQIHTWILSKSLQLLCYTLGQVTKDVPQIYLTFTVCQVWIQWEQMLCKGGDEAGTQMECSVQLYLLSTATSQGN